LASKPRQQPADRSLAPKPRGGTPRSTANLSRADAGALVMGVDGKGAGIPCVQGRGFQRQAIRLDDTLLGGSRPTRTLLGYGQLRGNRRESVPKQLQGNTASIARVHGHHQQCRAGAASSCTAGDINCRSPTTGSTKSGTRRRHSTSVKANSRVYLAGSATNAGSRFMPTSGTTNLQLPTAQHEGNVHHNRVTANSSTGDELFRRPGGSGGVASAQVRLLQIQLTTLVCGNLSSGDGGWCGTDGSSATVATFEHNQSLFKQSTIRRSQPTRRPVSWAPPMSILLRRHVDTIVCLALGSVGRVTASAPAS